MENNIQNLDEKLIKNPNDFTKNLQSKSNSNLNTNSKISFDINLKKVKVEKEEENQEKNKEKNEMKIEEPKIDLIEEEKNENENKENKSEQENEEKEKNEKKNNEQNKKEEKEFNKKNKEWKSKKSNQNKKRKKTNVIENYLTPKKNKKTKKKEHKKKKNHKQRSTHDSHQHKKSSKSSKIIELEQQISELQNILEETQKSNEEKLEKERSLTNKARNEISKLLIQQVQWEKKILRERVLRDNIDLGCWKITRRGVSINDWEDGELFKKLEQDEKKIKDEEEKVKTKKRRHIQKHKPNISNTSEKNPDSLKNLLEYQQQEEIFRIQLSTLRKNRLDLEKQRERLEYKKQNHIKHLQLFENQQMLNTQPLWEKRYFILSVLGQGPNSIVFKAYDFKNFRFVACKLYRLSSTLDPKTKSRMIKKALIAVVSLKQVQHIRVVQHYDCFRLDEASFCVVTELIERGDLSNLIQAKGSLIESESKCIVSQILSGVQALAALSPPVFHGDLKPTNILFRDDGAKISDFGLFDFILKNSSSDSYSQYLPRDFNSQSDSNFSKIDSWSVGLIFYEMLFGSLPSDFHNSENSRNPQNNSIDFPDEPQISQSAKEFISLCLNVNPDERPDPQTLANHPYLREHLKK
ncbi:tousled-like kinase isoform g [Anaeramoeba ignava]|uniref:Tousled-like kinase isoform g n=1 Tax=Anaeramoeba ignava TaxID=1746090 RepID=A0A9Q0LHA7_ANAIG|nr:tousled-like kinase isoform g [Anaeramoeba ignava]